MLGTDMSGTGEITLPYAYIPPEHESIHIGYPYVGIKKASPTQRES